MKRKELQALAEELGAVLSNEGRRWIATFPDVPSIWREGQPVQFFGTRSVLEQQLTDVKKWKELRAKHGEGSLGSFINGVSTRSVEE